MVKTFYDEKTCNGWIETEQGEIVDERLLGRGVG